MNHHPLSIITLVPTKQNTKSSIFLVSWEIKFKAVIIMKLIQSNLIRALKEYLNDKNFIHG